MQQCHGIARFAAIGLAAAGLVAGQMFAQERTGSNAAKNETTMTGCLTESSSGNDTLDEKTGSKTTVTGSADLEKHSGNHRVTLTGTAKTDASRSQVFEVSKIQHLSASCKSPAQ
jgi:hypothetical protein